MQNWLTPFSFLYKPTSAKNPGHKILIVATRSASAGMRNGEIGKWLPTLRVRESSLCLVYCAACGHFSTRARQQCV